jgi:hypothetical protein
LAGRPLRKVSLRINKLLLRIDKTSTGLGLQRYFEFAATVAANRDVLIKNISLPLVGNTPMCRSPPQKIFATTVVANINVLVKPIWKLVYTN